MQIKYYNYNYDENKYCEVSHAYHDHYTYSYEDNAFYEDILINNRGYSFKDLHDGLMEALINE